MKRDDLGDLVVFLAVAEERSFTKAAAKLGTSQSALSHIVRRLEERLDVKLLNRTTRSVTPTDAGEKLARSIAPAFEDIEAGLIRLNELQGRPAGTVRINASKVVAKSILMPVAARLMSEYPDVNIEITTDQHLVDIVKDGFDAGVRLGAQIDKDMIAVRIGPDVRMMVAGSPDYFQKHPFPTTPHELTDHMCVSLKFSMHGGVYVWEFGKDGEKVNVRVGGQFTCNDSELAVEAARLGQGLICLPNYLIEPYVASGELISVLEAWCPPFPGFHLYYPSRRQVPQALRLVIDSLRYSKS